jgi:hypothetical protein
VVRYERANRVRVVYVPDVPFGCEPEILGERVPAAAASIGRAGPLRFIQTNGLPVLPFSLSAPE